jgi:hypothetical protein
MKRSPDEEIYAAMDHIEEMRERFSADTCGEAWRRLGGQAGVEEWRKRTKPMPNIVMEINAGLVESSLKTAAEKLRDATKAFIQKEFYSSGVPSVTGDLAHRYVPSAAEDYALLREKPAVQTIVKNLRHYDPADIVRGINVLAGATPGSRCAFCGVAGIGAVHIPGCAFSTVPAPPQPVKTYGGMGALPGSPIPPAPVKATLSAGKDRPFVVKKDSLLNPAPKGFSGAGSLPYDSDYDG